MASYRFVPHRGLKADDEHSSVFEAVDDEAARLKGFGLFMALGSEIKSAALYDQQDRRIDTWGRA